MNFVTLTKVGMPLGPIVNVLGHIMEALFRFTSIFGVMNIGLSIILFTLVVKLLMFPLTIKQQKSTKLMAVMQPELTAIQNKYKGKKDNESMMKMNVETKAVYEKYGTSMTGGCLQLLIQMPILLALYQVIYNIPAYVSSVKEHFVNVVYAISGYNTLPSIEKGAASKLVQFISDHNINLNNRPPINDLTSLSGEALANKMIDALYKLNPAQWSLLAETFPEKSAGIILENAKAIESMNSFLGINLSTNPWQGFERPSLAWLIPVLAGLTQWYSTKMMTTKQSDDAPGAQMMKQMGVTMPLMSVVFCFTFPAAIGIYWVASSLFQIIQQLIVNVYMNRIDVDEMVKKNIEKANEKRAKKGLPPAKLNQNATVSLKQIQAKEELEEEKKAVKVLKTQEYIKESSAYYNTNAKSGSLAAKANMVAQYNERQNKSKK